MKHTKGNWEVDLLGSEKPIYIIHKETGLEICEFNYKSQLLSESEKYFNAKLIAAAPELLEALIKANEVLVNLPKAEFLIELLRECNQAIKKATE